MTDSERSTVFSDDGPQGDSWIVMHVDMDCFYAACEQLRHPDLEGEPIVVGMGYEEGDSNGVVATANYPARDAGVHSAQPIAEAIDLLPPDEGHYFPVDMPYYKSISDEVKAILHQMADVVREVSVDEAYLDVTDQTTWDRAEGYASGIKKRIQNEIGITSSIGVAPNMSAAKIASDYEKPDGWYLIRPSELREFLAPLDLEEIHEVGKETARELRERGIETAGDLAGADPDLLENLYGKRGVRIHRFARGEDHREVTPADPPKSFLRDSALSEPTSDLERITSIVKTLSEEVTDRARGEGALYRTIGIKVVTLSFEIHRRSQSLPGHVEDSDVVENIALELLEEFQDVEIRKIGVTVKNLSYEDQQQAGLSDWGGERDEVTSSKGCSRRPRGTENDEEGGQASLSDY